MRISVLGGLLSLLLLMGCATVPSGSGPEATTRRRAKLFRTQAGDQVTLQWQSEVSARYSVIYTPNLNNTRQWKLLAGFEDISGTGGAQSVTFTAPQSGKLYYRLQTRPGSR